MKILYMNLQYNNSGQRRMDENIIRELNKIANVSVVCPEGWYEHQIANVEYIYYSPKSVIKNRRIQYYSKSLKNVFFANKISRRKYNYYLFASYDTVLFSVFKIINPRILSKCFIIHNNNIDGINEKKLKKFFFQTYSKKVNHITLDSFIGEYLIESLHVNSKNVYVLPHPLNSNGICDKKEYDCVGISNSNDESWINEIIQKEKKTALFKKYDVKIVLRSHNLNYDDGYLLVINGWLSDEEYNNYINGAKCIFLPFPKSFKYRMSGSIVDAFSNYTAVIGSDIPLFNHYAKQYKGICKVVNSSDEFCYSVLLIKEGKVDNTDFDCFIQAHSQECVLKSLEGMFMAETE